LGGLIDKGRYFGPDSVEEHRSVDKHESVLMLTLPMEHEREIFVGGSDDGSEDVYYLF